MSDYESVEFFTDPALMTFIEETLRMESPVECHFRMAPSSTTIGDIPIPARNTVMPLPDASNRDARKFAQPGPAGGRRYGYEPTWQMRGLTELRLRFTPVA